MAPGRRFWWPARSPQLSGLPAFSALYRAYGWSAPLDPDATHVWGIDRLLAEEARVQSSLLFPGSNFRVAGPDRALIDVRDRARVGRAPAAAGGRRRRRTAAVVRAARGGHLRPTWTPSGGGSSAAAPGCWQRWLLALAEGGWMTALAARCSGSRRLPDRGAIAQRPASTPARVLGHSLLSARRASR